MITDETHPEMVAAQRELEQALGLATRGKQPSSSLFAELITIRDDHRLKWRLRGVDFPKMVFFVVPRLRVLELWRNDLDLSSIRTKVMNVALAFPAVTPEELAAGLRAAYPGLRSRELTDEGEALVRRVRERALDGTFADSVTLRARQASSVDSTSRR